MKNWPKNGDAVYIGDLLGPLERMLRKIYKEKKPGVDIDFNYKGHRVFGDNIQPDKRFSKEHLAHTMEYQDWDLIHHALVTAFQYGIEQGKRIDKDTVECVLLMARCGISFAKDLQKSDLTGQDKECVESLIKILQSGGECTTNLLPDDVKRKENNGK